MLPCEIAANYRVPVIKASLARRLKGRGESQKTIANLLGVTEAAVSQYLSGKRASRQQNKITKPKVVPQVCSICKFCR